MKSKLFILGSVLILSALIVTSCGPRAAQPKEIARSEKQRVTSPDVAEANLTELVSGNSAFAFDLYQAIREKEGNLFYSPYSISLALAMTYAGARGETERQMADTIHFILSQDLLHPAFNALDLELASRGETVREEEGRFQLNIANSIWGQVGYSFLPEFLDVLAENYGAGLGFLDFKKETEKSRGIINHWVSDETEGKIKDLLQPGAITPGTLLVLANAIYFDAKWSFPFRKENTHDGVFHLLDGGEVTVPMMSQETYFGYAEDEGVQAVELPYKGGETAMLPEMLLKLITPTVELPYKGEEMAMVILLPEAGRFEEFESSLDAERVDAIVQELRSQEVDLTMPKFTYDSRLSLNETLAEMGMPDAFTGAADFSGMTGSRDLFLSAVEHKAFVSVDEAGTKAAAATGEVVIGAALGVIKVTIDHPFIFVIRDIKTGAILFIGRVVNPSA